MVPFATMCVVWLLTLNVSAPPSGAGSGALPHLCQNPTGSAGCPLGTSNSVPATCSHRQTWVHCLSPSATLELPDLGPCPCPCQRDPFRRSYHSSGSSATCSNLQTGADWTHRSVEELPWLRGVHRLAMALLCSSRTSYGRHQLHIQETCRRNPCRGSCNPSYDPCAAGTHAQCSNCACPRPSASCREAAISR